MFDGFAKTQPEPEGPFRFVNGASALLCAGCQKPKRAKPVRGKYSSRVQCNAKCLSSRGFNCECSCGGKNHGKAYEP
jgi:hypothetical protein